MEYLLLQLLLVDTKHDFVELYQSIYINLVWKKYVFWLILLKNNCAYSFMWIVIYWVPRIDTYHGDKTLMHRDAPVNRYTRIRDTCNVVKVLIRLGKSCSFMTDDAIAQLWQCLSNINVVSNSSLLHKYLDQSLAELLMKFNSDLVNLGLISCVKKGHWGTYYIYSQMKDMWSHRPKCVDTCYNAYSDSKFHGANMGPIWGRQDPGGSHVGPMNLAIWVYSMWNNTDM